MALTQYPGCFGPLWPFYPAFSLSAAPAFQTSNVIDATGEKIAMIGQVMTPNRSTKSIRNIGFRFGTVVKAGGSGLTVSLQDVSTSTANAPDETQDQTVAIANGDASFASDTWIKTSNLSADRSVSHGEFLAVVVEYDGSGRQGSDSVIVQGMTASSIRSNFCYCSLKTASWAVSGGIPNLVLYFSDGTCGTFAGATCFSALGSTDFSSSSTPDELSNQLSPPVPKKFDGFWALQNLLASNRDFDVVLYEGTTPMTGGTVSFDATAQASGVFMVAPFSQEITLAPSTTYRLAFKPTTTGSIRVYHFDVNEAAIMQALPGGESIVYNTRTDAGAWDTATTTRRLWCGLVESSGDDGAGGGASGGYIY